MNSTDHNTNPHSLYDKKILFAATTFSDAQPAYHNIYEVLQNLSGQFLRLNADSDNPSALINNDLMKLRRRSLPF